MSSPDAPAAVTSAGQPQPGTLPPKPRSLWRWVGLGCGGLILLCGGGSLAIALVAMGAMRQSDAYARALAEVRASPELKEALGEPVEPGWWVSGSIETTGASGSCELAFPVSGPRGEARVFVEAVKRAGRWHQKLLQVELASGKRIDLLDAGSGTREVVEEFFALMSSGDYAAAHELFSESLRGQIPLERFGRDSERAASLFQTRELRLSADRAVDGGGVEGPALVGTLLLSNGREVEAAFMFERQGDAWRIRAYSIDQDQDP